MGSNKFVSGRSESRSGSPDTGGSKIMVALDYPSIEEANQLLDQLESFQPYLKVGMQLFYISGPVFIQQLKERGFFVFLDLKLHDIPNTVEGAAQALTKLGVDLFNVHCSGGRHMIESALEGVEKGRNGNQVSPKVIGVTQLTSTSRQMLNEELQIPGNIEESVLHLAGLAKASGLAGVVCSPLEVERIKANYGSDFMTVTPGIRPGHDRLAYNERGANSQGQKNEHSSPAVAADDQVRITTPTEAARLGTDYMVIGRPITAAQDPALAYSMIKEEIERGSQ